MPSTALRAGAVEAEVVEGFDVLPTWQLDWERLFLACPNEPSTSFEWTSAMTRSHLKEGDRPVLIRLLRDERTVGIVPLVLRTLPVLGSTVGLLAPLTEENNTHSEVLIADDEECFDGLVDAVFAVKGWDCFRMARLLDEGRIARGLKAALERQGRSFHVRNGLAAYVLDVPQSFDAYLAQRSAKFRNHLKRTERKLRAAGDVRVRSLQDGDDFEEGYEALLQIERQSWKQEHGSSITAIDRQSTFYRDLCVGALKHDRLHLQWMTIGDAPVAYNLGYLHGRIYHYLKTSYAAGFRELSPSTFLRAELIRTLIDAGVTAFDFPGEPYEWETQWTDRFRWRSVITVYRPTVRGRLLSLAERIKHGSQPNRRLDHLDPRRAGTGSPQPALPAES